MNLHLTEKLPWAQRQSLVDEPGIYVISKGSDVVYIGRTWSANGLRGRISQFNRSATTGQEGHAGGVTFFGTYGALNEAEMSVAVHVPSVVRREVEILRSYIQYAERRLIWEFVERHARLPACNSE